MKTIFTTLKLNEDFWLTDQKGQEVTKTKYKTLVLSDIHLGSKYSKAKEVLSFLNTIECETLILNGDIIDGWQLKKGYKHWNDTCTQFIKKVISKTVKEQTNVIYIRGNHDDFLDKIIPFVFPNLTIVKDYILTTQKGRYFVLHGDIFDHITKNMKWLAVIGDIGYNFLLSTNKFYNYIRRLCGKPYYSLSYQIKQKVKSAVSYISDFENEIVGLAHVRHCQGVICGHIHSPANCYYKNIQYLNAGDWIESLTALVEDESGEWTVLYYKTISTK